eukprot:1181260-Prorocentrum_minimum.AAC.3
MVSDADHAYNKSINPLKHHLVVQDVALGLLQQLQNLVLQVLQLLLVRRQAADQTVLGLLKVEALLADQIPQQLVLQPLGGDGEVDHRHLDAHLRQVVRVGQLGGYVELEVLVIVHVAVPDPHHHAVALLERLRVRRSNTYFTSECAAVGVEVAAREHRT